MTHHGFTLPERAGSAPSIDGPNPHTQTSQNAPHDLQETLFDRAAQLPGVTVADSLVSVPGARAFILAEDHAKGPAEAFQKGREFAHIHPVQDGSFHMTLPEHVAQEAYAKGWGEPHPKSGTPLIFGPRDDAELEVVWTLLLESWRFATGQEDIGTGQDDDDWTAHDPLSHPDIARMDRTQLADLPFDPARVLA